MSLETVLRVKVSEEVKRLHLLVLQVHCHLNWIRNWNWMSSKMMESHMAVNLPQQMRLTIDVKHLRTPLEVHPNWCRCHIGNTDRLITTLIMSKFKLRKETLSENTTQNRF
jgi:hypothetical protein